MRYEEHVWLSVVGAPISSCFVVSASVLIVTLEEMNIYFQHTQRCHRSGTVGSQNRRFENLIFTRFTAKFFAECGKGLFETWFRNGDKEIVLNWLSMHFYIENFHLGTVWFGEDHEGVL